MTASSIRSSSARGLVRQYRAPLLAAIPIGVVLGALADLALSVSTVHASNQDRLPALFIYACIGAAFSSVASIGAVIAVLTDPGRAAAGTLWFRIAAGAGLAVLVGVLLLGGISTAVTDSWGWFPTIAVTAVVTGLLAGATASATTAFFKFRHRLLP